jgi:hypothetical protein
MGAIFWQCTHQGAMNSRSTTFSRYDDKETVFPVRPLGPITGNVKSGAGLAGVWPFVGDSVVADDEVELRAGATLGVGDELITVSRETVLLTSEQSSSFSRYAAPIASAHPAPVARNFLRFGFDMRLQTKDVKLEVTNFLGS